ncbi:T9SS type A sorting domain-containing protein [Patiriisocius sp. Uisw_017]|jgi:hypothetical protein|uniref:T9SS type A sorting domain-containing protein n=1 Tax=Patiriisocius sp. Uisw_017 TaxID=3230968 RepID=UPI0039E80AE5
MKKLLLLLILLVSSSGFCQSPYPALADNKMDVATQKQGANQNNFSETFPTVTDRSVESHTITDGVRLEGRVQGVRILGNCITEDFNGYTLPSGSASPLPGITVLNETTVVNGQGPGLVADGCVYISMAGELQWNGVDYFGQANQTIIANGTDGTLTLQYDLTVDAVDFELSAFDGFPDSVTIEALNDSGASLGTLGPVAVPVSTLVPVSFAVTGIKTIRIVGIYDGVNGFSPLLNNHVFCPDGSAPSNDLCADAVPVVCNDTFSGDTSIATDTGGNAAPDVWYSYTGTGVEQDITLSLCDGGTDYDSLIRVFDACGGAQITANDDSCGLQSEVTFTSDGTSTYLIMVEGFGSSSGAYSLTVSCNPDNPAENDLCENATIVACDDLILGDTSSSTDTGGNAAPDVWFSFTGTGIIENVTLSLCDGGTDYDSVIRVFDACDGTEIAINDDSCGVQSELTFISDGTSTYLIMIEGFGSSSGAFSLAVTCAFIIPDNDLCEDAIAVACGDTVTGETNSATDTGANPAPDVWYSYTGGGLLEEVTISLCDGGTDYDSYIRIFNACGGSQIATNDDSCGLQSEVTFTSDGASTYYIMIEGFGAGAGAFSMAVSCEVIVPDNDECADAIALGCGDIAIGNTSQATDSGGNAAPDLWYSFTGTGSEQDVTISLCDDSTDYDTYLRVFDACGGTEIAVNDDFCFTSSELTFTSDGTSTYFIMVEGFLTLSGSFNLAVSCNPDDPESNDDCVSAIDVNCGDTVVGETTTATDSGSNPSPDVFFSFTGEGVMQDITLSLCDGGTDYDSLLRVFDACDGNEIVANDDFCGAQSELTFTSDGTATYIIMVEGFSTSSGNFSLTISCNPDDVELNDTCEEATPVACGDVILGDTSIGTDTGGNLAPDLWYSYTGGGLLEEVTISLCDGGTDYDSLIRVFDACGGGEIAVNDDACGLQSELTFTSDGTSTYFIMVEGFGASSGNFTMSVTCEPLGIDDIDFAGFNYYPNPANETINFSSLEDIDSIAIYNVIGQQVIAQSVHAISGQLNVSNLRTGTYIMEVTIGVKTATYKVIKR